MQQVSGVATMKSGSASFAQVVKNEGAIASQEDAASDINTSSFNFKSEVPKWLECSFVESLSKASNVKVV